MNKKSSAGKGFTLAEMLIAVMLLGLVTIMATVMTSAVFNTTALMQETAQAEILGSEALNNIQNRLRYAQNVVLDGEEKSVTFDADENNAGCSFGVEEGKIVYRHKVNGSYLSDPLFNGVSYGNLEITDLQFTASADGKSVQIDVWISYGEKVLWSGGVSVIPLNGM